MAGVVGVPVVAGVVVLAEALGVLEVAGGSGTVGERSEADSMGGVWACGPPVGGALGTGEAGGWGPAGGVRAGGETGPEGGSAVSVTAGWWDHVPLGCCPWARRMVAPTAADARAVPAATVAAGCLRARAVSAVSPAP